MILVTGPMSSGTRLLTRVLEGPGRDVRHDASHGTKDQAAEAVVCIVRDADATKASQIATWGEPIIIERNTSLMGIVMRYPHALWVTYEQLCAHPDEVISYLATRLGLEPWVSSEECLDQNGKWWSGVGGPSLGDPFPPTNSVVVAP